MTEHIVAKKADRRRAAYRKRMEKHLDMLRSKDKKRAAAAAN